ncbi:MULTISPECIES: hypothetical protein [unclassified Duganella]|uniref:hypothetical protein n=1 Tax=unclassified Duganella TaxID=2636909 RepID=UPI0006F41835|nr:MULTISPECIES: hypothetical protein [unclassified Duganella]KQV54791.1 hypothetical protein ASD07_28960 [Duganella sp. Root336D2]KRB92798.1 hypothetical protein ASE26_28745 [Duganella sp. Root198D2]
MEHMLQWKASYCRSDGSTGRVYMALPSEPLCSDLVDTILQWDTDHMYLQAEACPGTDRLTQAIAFLELNHITSVHVSSLDDEIDSSSDA